MPLGLTSGLFSDLSRRARNWRRPARRRATETALRAIEQDLAGFSGSVEGVFLQVGERLMHLQVRAREIAAQASSIADLLSKDEGSLAALGEALEAAGGGRQKDGTVGAIQGIQGDAQGICRTVECFGRLVKTFDVLGVMTRIESARFESAGGNFVVLADAVVVLSGQIREHIGATAVSVKALLETGSGAAEKVRVVAQTRHDNLGPLTRRTSAGIQTLADRRSRAAQANTVFAARFQGVSRAMGDLVSALQSHDIVRQQIEHVVAALSQLDPVNRCDSNLFAALLLQTAQLDNSRATFAKSVEQIGDALARIEQNIEEVAADRRPCWSVRR